jgi:hypothetical protein
MLKINTWLPIFSGFYNTIWESDDDYLCTDIIEQCEEKDYSKEKIDKIVDSIWWSNHYRERHNEYCIEITEELTKEIEKILEKMEMIHAINYQTIVSPKQYNFTNDGVNVEVKLKKSHVKNIKKYLKNNFENWKTYLKERYTSYDGFISFHDNYPESSQWEVDNAVQHEHRLGSILNFILLNDHLENGEEESLEYKLYENVQGNTSSCLLSLECLEKELATKETT